MTKTPAEVNSKSVELLPCAFCNGEAYMHHNDDYGSGLSSYYGVCKKCGCYGPEEWIESAAIKSWNTRNTSTPTPSEAEMVEAIADIIDTNFDKILKEIDGSKITAQSIYATIKPWLKGV